ncbi:MAG TPA: hypothetical protein PLW86_08725 [Rhodocyclaceae bacterium]|nr:hypothetical protein [Rhodocyclaceae bacterium]
MRRNPLIDREAIGVDFAGIARGAEHAVRLAVMSAVAEAALAEIGAEFTKGVFQCVSIQMAQAEFLQAGGIDQVRIGIQVIEAGMSRW